MADQFNIPNDAPPIVKIMMQYHKAMELMEKTCTNSSQDAKCQHDRFCAHFEEGGRITLGTSDDVMKWKCSTCGKIQCKTPLEMWESGYQTSLTNGFFMDKM
jgi:hypothetical protein